MKDWKQALLSEFIQFKNGKKRPSGVGTVPVYGGNGVLGYTNRANNENSIIIGRVGAYCGSVYYEQSPHWVSDNAISAVNKGNSDIIFDYYILKSLDLNHRHIGTSQPLLTQEILNSVEVVLPPLLEQVEIGHTLRALDDKIENNRKINHHLEQMAQAIFTELCSEGENAMLSDILTVCYGKNHKKLSDGKIPCYGSGGIMRYVDEAIYSGESVLIPRKGSLNNVLYINGPFWTVDTMFYTHMKRPNVAKFVYFTVRDLDLAGMNVGSAVPSMTTSVLNALEIVLPSNDNLASFEGTVSPMFLQMQANNTESARLAALRDALLPKFISGELSVADLGDAK